MSMLSEGTQEALKLYKTCVRNLKRTSPERVFLHHSLTSFSPSEPNMLAFATQNGMLQVCLPAWAKCRIKLWGCQYCMLYVLNAELFKEMFSQKEFSKFTDECRESKDDT